MLSEKEIQEYIWNNKDDFSNLFEPANFPVLTDKKPWEYTPSELLYFHMIERYEKIWNSLYYLDFFGCEVPLKKENDSTIRADFLGALEGQNGIVIIELKKSKQTERQSYTELLAYSNHLRNTFAPMCKADIVYLLIAPMHERIVREATINTLLYDNNNVCALIPSWENNDVSTLKLKLWIPEFSEFVQISEGSITQSNFEICKITWEALPGNWSPDKKGESPKQYMIDRLNSISTIAAQMMEAYGIHGFVYCSQAYSELGEILPLTNALIIGGLNPYKVTKNRTLISNGTMSIYEADNTSVDDINMMHIIPELERSANEENMTHNYFSELSYSWLNKIYEIGFRIVKIMTKSLDRDNIELGYGSFDWKTFQEIMIEDILCYNFRITLTGIMRELFIEYSVRDWDYIKENGYEDHPIYSHGDIPHEIVDIFNSHIYIREFIKRLYSPYHELEQYI